MPAAVTVTDLSTHGGLVTGPGVATVLICGKPAAVLGERVLPVDELVGPAQPLQLLRRHPEGGDDDDVRLPEVRHLGEEAPRHADRLGRDAQALQVVVLSVQYALFRSYRGTGAFLLWSAAVGVGTVAFFLRDHATIGIRRRRATRCTTPA